MRTIDFSQSNDSNSSNRNENCQLGTYSPKVGPIWSENDLPSKDQSVELNMTQHWSAGSSPDNSYGL